MRTLKEKEVYEALLDSTNIIEAMRKLYPEEDPEDRATYKRLWGRTYFHVKKLLDLEALRKVPGTRSPAAYTRGRDWRTYEDRFLGSEEDRRVRCAVLPLNVHQNRFYMKVLEAPYNMEELERDGWENKPASGVSQWIKKVNLSKLEQPILKRFTVVWRDGKSSSSIVVYVDPVQANTVSSMKDLEDINYSKVLAVQRWLQNHYGFRLSLATETPLKDFEAEVPESVVLAAKSLGLADGQLIYFDQSPKGRGGAGHFGTRDVKTAWSIHELPQTSQKVDQNQETLLRVQETLQNVREELQHVKNQQGDHVELIETMAGTLQEVGRALSRSNKTNKKLLEFLGEGAELDLQEENHGYQ